MSTDPAFEKRVEDIFLIRGRGMIVVGSIKSGVLKVGDTITIRGQRKSVHSGIAKKSAITLTPPPSAYDPKQAASIRPSRPRPARSGWSDNSRQSQV